jgi:hypothetical protein
VRLENVTVLQSRSDFMMVAVDFSPRAAAAITASLSDARKVSDPFKRRSATQTQDFEIRGLKYTAMINPSLREVRRKK